MLLAGCVASPLTPGSSSPHPASGMLFQYERDYLTAHPPLTRPAAQPAPSTAPRRSAIPRPQGEADQARERGMVATTPGSALANYMTRVD